MDLCAARAPWDALYSRTVAGAHYHIGFGADDVPDGTSIVLLSGDPARSELIATKHLSDGVLLARSRGLDAFHARLPSGRAGALRDERHGCSDDEHRGQRARAGRCATVIRIGTSGSIRDEVRAGTIVIAPGPSPTRSGR